LLRAVKELFIKRYGTEFKKQNVTHIDCSHFDPTYETLLRRLDTGSAGQSQSPYDSESQVELTPPSSSASVTDEPADHDAPPPPMPGVRMSAAIQRRDIDVSENTSTDATPVATPDTSRPSTPLHAPARAHLLTAKAGPGKTSRRARKAGNSAQSTSAPFSSGDEASVRAGKGSKNVSKQKRRWDEHGMMVDGDDGEVLDYSAPSTGADDRVDQELDIEEVKAEDMGKRTGKGQFVLKDLEDEVDAILASSKSRTQDEVVGDDSGLLVTATSKLSGLFRNVVGGKKLSKQELQQPLQQMQNHLLQKNVAREAAERLCQSVEADLLDQKTASFTSIDRTIRESMAKALTRMLTPTSSLDLLRNVTSTIEGPNARPYVISIVGVNGVGKSTNLSKIAYFLLQNKFRVLVVAGDTFRSGAVEQLRVHVRNLSELSRRDDVGYVELFEKGYGKDAATVARDAVQFASNRGKGEMLYDVVLIDTAGRRHNDSRLMSSLTKFGQLANPDKIFMVGEALVGTDSVAQARNFAKEFVDTKGVMRNGGVGMDGFIISKCDTVGDMVGTLVSMVHATGKPTIRSSNTRITSRWLTSLRQAFLLCSSASDNTMVTYVVSTSDGL
jgi:signal recognition particle receptor subunit alpha